MVGVGWHKLVDLCIHRGKLLADVLLNKLCWCLGSRSLGASSLLYSLVTLSQTFPFKDFMLCLFRTRVDKLLFWSFLLTIIKSYRAHRLIKSITSLESFERTSVCSFTSVDVVLV